MHLQTRVLGEGKQAYRLEEGRIELRNVHLVVNREALPVVQK